MSKKPMKAKKPARSTKPKKPTQSTKAKSPRSPSHRPTTPHPKPERFFEWL
jgi:hypothetical protein